MLNSWFLLLVVGYALSFYTVRRFFFFYLPWHFAPEWKRFADRNPVSFRLPTFHSHGELFPDIRENYIASLRKFIFTLCLLILTNRHKGRWKSICALSLKDACFFCRDLFYFWYQEPQVLFEVSFINIKIHVFCIC